MPSLCRVPRTPCGSFLPPALPPQPLTLTPVTAAAVTFAKQSLMVSLRDVPWLSAESSSSLTQPCSSGLYSPAGLYSTTSPDLLSQEYACNRTPRPSYTVFPLLGPFSTSVVHHYLFFFLFLFFLVIKEPSRDFQSYGKLSVNFLPQAGFPALGLFQP